MKLLITIAIFLFFSIHSNSAEHTYTLDIKDHPVFQKTFENLLVDDLPVGEIMITKTTSFGDAGESQNTFIAIQKLAALSPKLALILKINAAGVDIECGDPMSPVKKLQKEFCKNKSDFLTVYNVSAVSEVSAY